MSVFLAYLILGAFFVTFALGKDIEQFRDKNDPGYIIVVNAIFGIFIWPIVVLVALDIGMDVEKTKRKAKEGK